MWSIFQRRYYYIGSGETSSVLPIITYTKKLALLRPSIYHPTQKENWANGGGWTLPLIILLETVSSYIRVFLKQTKPDRFIQCTLPPYEMNSIKISTLNLCHWMEVLEHLSLDQSFPTRKYLMKVRNCLQTSLLILREFKRIN